MAVTTPPISIEPYTSSVPLIQVPQQDYAEPQQAPRLFSRKAGIAEVGDDVMRGVLRGLAVKEQRKQAKAEATITALDKSTSDAYDNYQRALATGKKEEADAAYGVYLNTFNQAKQAKAQFAIPEQKPKEKGSKDKKKDEQGAATGGFAAGLKQFFERNPHVIPELALVAMQPKPPGPSVDTIKTQQDIKAGETQAKLNDAAVLDAQRKQGAQAVYDELGKIPQDKLSPEQIQKLDWAKSVIFPEKFTGRYFVYSSPDKKQKEAFHPGEEPPGWQIEDKPGSVPKPGTEQEFTNQALKGYGFTADNAPPNLLKYLHDTWQYKAAQTTTGAHEELRPDPVTGQLVAVKVGTSTTRGTKPPAPPSGFAPLGEDGMPTKGGMTAAPTAPSTGGAKTSGTAKGGITTPPGVRDTGVRSTWAAQDTQKVETEKKDRYAKAQATYDKAIQTARLKAKTPEVLDQMKKEAQQKLDAEKAEIEKWYGQQIRGLGKAKDPEPPSGATVIYRDNTGVVQGWAVNGEFVPVGKQ